MKIKRLSYDEFKSIASLAGDAIPPNSEQEVPSGYVIITFEFFRVMGNRVYEESVSELQDIADQGDFPIDRFEFDWEDASLGPYEDSEKFPSPNIRINQSENTDFWFTNFSIKPDNEERYDYILDEAERIVKQFPQCALIAHVQYYFNTKFSHPLCVLVEEDKYIGNPEIIKIVI
jgi:hypothetical protein